MLVALLLLHIENMCAHSRALGAQVRIRARHGELMDAGLTLSGQRLGERRQHASTAVEPSS